MTVGRPVSVGPTHKMCIVRTIDVEVGQQIRVLVDAAADVCGSELGADATGGRTPVEAPVRPMVHAAKRPMRLDGSPRIG